MRYPESLRKLAPHIRSFGDGAQTFERTVEDHLAALETLAAGAAELLVDPDDFAGSSEAWLRRIQPREMQDWALGLAQALGDEHFGAIRPRVDSILAAFGAPTDRLQTVFERIERRATAKTSCYLTAIAGPQ